MSYPEAGIKNTTARGHCTPNVGGALPNHLGKVRRLRVTRVIVGYTIIGQHHSLPSDLDRLTSFICPPLNGGELIVVITSASCKILWRELISWRKIPSQLECIFGQSHLQGDRAYHQSARIRSCWPIAGPLPADCRPSSAGPRHAWPGTNYVRRGSCPCFHHLLRHLRQT